MAYSPSRRRFYQWFARVHGALLIRTDGRPHRLGRSQYALVLATTGRRSGQERLVPLLYLPDGDGYVVLASNYGQERPPAWWFNLEARPEAEVRVAGRQVPVRARVFEGDERTEMLARMAAYNPQWAEYQRSVQRELPVVRLEPRT